LKVSVCNLTRDAVLGHAVEVADTSGKRNVGLLRHERLEPGEGMWILPSESVHTFFMKFAIDLVYIDRELKVRKVCRAVRPWRVSGCLRAHSVIEFPAGTIERSGTSPGDQLKIEKQD